jgi:hypothetical protein
LRTAAFDQARAIEHRMDGTFGWNGYAGEPANQALTDFASTPAGVLVLYVQDEVFHLERKSVGVAIRTSSSVREPLHAAFLVAIEDLAAGLAGDSELPAKLATNCSRSSITEHSFQGITPACLSLGVQSNVLPMSQAAHQRHARTSASGV